MKVLFEKSMKPLRVGEYVQANKSAGEFIYDTDMNGVSKDTVSRATLLGIVKRNGINIGSTNKTTAAKCTSKELIALINEFINSAKLPEVNEMTDTDKTLEIVKAGKAANKTDDQIIIEIVQAGIGYQNALKSFKKALVELGFIKKEMAKKDRDEIINKALDKEKFKADTFEAWDARATKFVEEFEKAGGDVVTYSAAYGSIRTYAKEHGLDIPKKQKRSEPAASQVKKLVTWMVDNLDKDEAAWVQHCEAMKLGKSRTKIFGEVFTTLKELLEAPADETAAA